MPVGRQALAVLLSCGLWAAAAQAAPEAHAPRETDKPAVSAPAEPAPGITATRIRDDVYVLAGAGPNVVVQIGPQGAVVVDSGDAAHADQVLAAIRSLTNDPIRYLFDTGADPDHAGGNLVLAQAGRAFGQSLGGPFGSPGIAVIVASEGAAMRLSQGDDSDGWPTHSVSVRSAFYLNNQGVEVIAKPAAHSDADAVVLFRRSDVLVTGEIFDITRFPIIDVDHGGAIQGEIDALNALIELAIPNVPLTWLPGGTLVVPAHGRICQQAELVDYRDMVVIVRDRIKSLKDQGKTLDQVLQSDPTAGYAERYGGKAGNGPSAAFVTAIYKTLSPAAEQKP